MSTSESWAPDTAEYTNDRSLAYNHPSTNYGADSATPAYLPCQGRVHCNGQSIPYNVSARFSCQPNVPLATIAERTSHWTLKSHPSHNVARRPHHAQVLYSTSSTTKRPSMSSRRKDEAGVNNQERRGNCQIGDRAGPNADLTTQCSEGIPIKKEPRGGELAGSSKRSGVGIGTEEKGLKALLRGILQNFRSASRHSEARSPLVTSQLPETLTGEGKQLMGRNQACAQLSRDEFLELGTDNCQPLLSEYSTWKLLSSPHTPHECSRKFEHSVHRHENASYDSIHPFARASPFWTTPLADQYDSRAYNGSEAPGANHRGGIEILRKSTSDTTPVEEGYFKCAREVSPSCSASTRYSGTVLGVDVDLEQEFPNMNGPSPSPNRSGTPVYQPSQEKLETPIPTRNAKPPKSITSFALPVLLPLAAAAGIVQVNTTTTTLSFYSPSGSLIQVVESPISSFPAAKYYQNALAASETSSTPAALNTTALPRSCIVLSAHLKHDKSSYRKNHSQLLCGTAQTSSASSCNSVDSMNHFAPKSGTVPALKPRDQQTLWHNGIRPSVNLRARIEAVVSCSPSSNGRRQKWRTKSENGFAAYGNHENGSISSGKSKTSSKGNHHLQWSVSMSMPRSCKGSKLVLDA
ncbi:uncharacterized protein EI97DRAFT_442047 [Westerdykella ornata]|uniref:Uncharacterized protein n=1 Tax=Westerdykella ornata TaxID=318751 RepID=A0A6A6JJI6_WESOR|nr:uncharacterized protein EI97DRAFT_442047 [Westerdykella ornata]KAF2276657.1 hypothetical protein EI97DRAFT_442047 [Westerdykella ornata]